MPAVTAAETSMADVLVPATAARILLMLIAEFVVVVLACSELTEETELMMSTCFFEVASLWIHIAYSKS
jgi:hypothetical protein